MNNYLYLIPVFLPIISGCLFLFFPTAGKNRPHETNKLLTEGIVILNSIILWVFILTLKQDDPGMVLFNIYSNLKVYFHLDGTGKIFAGLVAFLWPLATLYAFEYMEHDQRERGFFAFYTMTYGVTLGIACSGNLVTLYVFYEMLTLVTFPLVLHSRTKESRRAARKYLYFSIGGAAFAFIGMVFIVIYGSTTEFLPGGVVSQTMIDLHGNQLLLMYVMAFFGFGVKAAIFPVHRWLPSASVAPTPVTALLHAVAVVKSGAFAIIRLTYFSYGAAFIKGTWAQYVVAGFVLFTIAYGSTMACKEIHFKKRLAYSTIANLSYILAGVVMMSSAGLVAALSHLVFHAIMKICAFFCAGAVQHHAHKNYVYELDGLGRKMPITFAAFTVSAMSLMGVPLCAGFISKWNIAAAAVAEGSVLGVITVAVLLYSAAMTAIYTMTVVVRAFFPKKGFDYSTLDGCHDPSWKMCLPLGIFVILIFALGIYSRPLMNVLLEAVKGVTA